MKKSSLFFVTLIIAAFYTFAIKAQNVIINEFSQGDASDHDWIELIVTTNGTDMRGVYFTTSSAGSGGGLYDGNKVQFSNNSILQSLDKGSIILIYKVGQNYNGHTSDPILPADDFSFTNNGNDKVVVVGFDATNINTTFFTATSAWPGFVGSTGDNIGLFDASDNGIFAVGYGTNGTASDFSFSTSDKVLISAVTGGNSAHFTGDNTVTNGLPNDNNKWSIVADGSSTPGTTNGGFNDGLPVELTSFSASVVNGNSVKLTWKTATEVNNYGFDVERSSGNSGWKKIGFVAGSGNSNSPKEYSFADNPSGGTSFSYRLKQIDVGGSFQYYDPVTVNLTLSDKPQLLQNSPNPFNPSTTIKFYTPNTSDVSIKIYDMLGREVTTLINKETTAGYHIVYWNGRDSRGENVASGVYLYRLTAGSFSETKKMNLLK